MRRIAALTLPAVLTLLVLGCSEKSPVAPDEPVTPAERSVIGEYTGVIKAHTNYLIDWRSTTLVRDVEFAFQDSTFYWLTEPVEMTGGFVSAHGVGTWLQVADSILLVDRTLVFAFGYHVTLNGWFKVEWLSDTLKLSQELAEDKRACLKLMRSD